MANAPLVGQDGGSCAVDLPDEGSGIFLHEGLDEGNHAEIAKEIGVSAQAKIWPIGQFPVAAPCRIDGASDTHPSLAIPVIASAAKQSIAPRKGSWIASSGL
jgi:hypothetical protein